jgi:pilus assembly protein Flp/PilA
MLWSAPAAWLGDLRRLRADGLTARQLNLCWTSRPLCEQRSQLAENSRGWVSAPAIGPIQCSCPAKQETGLKHQLVRFFRDETAATAIEYGLIAAGIAVAIITVTKGVGSKLNTTFTSVQTALK